MGFVKRLGYLISVIIISIALTAPAAAKDISLREAVDLVQQRYPGKVLKASQTRIKDNTFYRIKVMTKQGRVVTLLVNADTGRIRKE
ncbi:PepSY domain-containing protein [Glaciecola sp. 1036]|uniref:PepSY domain-containing protein n=1 Tax=Alteromonadaceae TaxID=72275 RepID=UPI003D01EC2D